MKISNLKYYCWMDSDAYFNNQNINIEKIYKFLENPFWYNLIIRLFSFFKRIKPRYDATGINILLIISFVAFG